MSANLRRRNSFVFNNCTFSIPVEKLKSFRVLDIRNVNYLNFLPKTIDDIRNIYPNLKILILQNLKIECECNSGLICLLRKIFNQLLETHRNF